MRCDKSANPEGGRVDSRELASRAVAYLCGVLESEPKGRQLSQGISAASRLLSHAEWAEENSLDNTAIRMFGGPDAMLRWLAENRERLELRLGGGNSPAPSVSPQTALAGHAPDGV
jgi:hypothetical protein